MLLSSLFDIEVVYVEGTREFVNKEDVRLMAENNALGHNIFKFNTNSLEAKLANNLLGAKSYQVQKDLPNTLDIMVNERIPIAIIHKDSDEYFLVDEDGYVLGYTDPEDGSLPRIKYDKDVRVGQFIDKNLVPIYLELTDLFKEQEVPVSSMSFSAKYVHLFLVNDTQVLIGNQKNKLEALKTTAALLKEAELEDKEIRTIDLRYDKVIVLFK